MFLLQIQRCVEVCIQAVPTLTTKEKTLRTTIVSGLVPTCATGLAGVARVNLDDLDSPGLRFVGKKALELGNAPTVHTSLSFAFTVGHLYLVEEHKIPLRKRSNGRGRPEDGREASSFAIFSLPRRLGATQGGGAIR